MASNDLDFNVAVVHVALVWGLEGWANMVEMKGKEDANDWEEREEKKGVGVLRRERKGTVIFGIFEGEAEVSR